MNKEGLKERGITLIALVVTIIILLILAGITISQITGEDGLFQRARQAADKYKEESEKEEIQIAELEKYVTDFDIVGGNDKEDPTNPGSGEETASVKITGVRVEALTLSSIKVTVEVEGEASKIEYSIDNGESWKEGEGENKKECTFEGLGAGGYFARVKAYDKENRHVEAISKAISLSASSTAEVEDVLEGKTFGKNGEIKTGTMTDNKELNGTLSAGDKYIVPKGFTSGGEIVAKTLAEQTEGDAKEEDIASGKIAWVNGKRIVGTKSDSSSKIVDLGTYDFGLRQYGVSVSVKEKLEENGVDYTKLTNRNFSFEFEECQIYGGDNSQWLSWGTTISYEQETGTVTCKSTGVLGSSIYEAKGKVHIYCCA